MTTPQNTPQTRYADRLEKGEFLQDAAQAQVVALLDDLYLRLTRREEAGGITRLLGVFRKPVREPELGLYVWGGVGRGNSPETGRPMG